jgi:hypothetical protein
VIRIVPGGIPLRTVSRRYWLTFCGLILVEMPSVDDITKAPLKTERRLALQALQSAGPTGIAPRRRPHRSPLGDGAVSFLVRNARSVLIPAPR